MANSRIEWLDSAKGFGTLLVILGHNLGFIYAQPDWHRFIYTFHMPLFFLATGVTLNINQAGAIGKRALTLVMPYFVMSAIMMPVTHHFDPTTSYSELFLGILYGTGHTIDIVPLWFLTCTASSLGLLACLAYSFQSLKVNFPRIAPLTSFVLIVTGYALIGTSSPHLSFHYGWGTPSHSGLPWNLDLAPVAAGYMLLGRSVADIIPAKIEHNRIGKILVFTLLTSVLFLLVFKLGAKLDLNYRRVDSLYLGTFSSVLGIGASIALCLLIQKFKPITVPLTYVTQSGLIILWLHGGLQNKGFRIIFGNFFPSQNLAFWIGSFTFATVTPILIDRFIIKKTPLRSVFYPRIS